MMKHEKEAETTGNAIAELAKEYFDYFKPQLTLGTKFIELDMQDISQVEPDLSEEIYSSPEKTINLVQVALAEKFALKEEVRIRLSNLSSEVAIQIHNIRKDNELKSLKGIIKRITKVLPRTTKIYFECPSCGAVLSKIQERKKITSPSRCSCGRQGQFRRSREEKVNIQELALEEIHDELDGKPPQQIRVYLEGDLTERELTARLQPGRKIEVIGITQELPVFMTSKDEKQNISEFMVMANNIILLDADDDLTINEEDIRCINEIAVNDPLQQLSESLAPEVYGNEEIKKAVVLQLVKGVSRQKSDGTYTNENIHLLLCGDPGIAKSVCLKAAVARTPRAKMVVATKTSKAGLTATVVKDELTGTFSLEAAAMVLCNNSIIAIDELDKLHKEHVNDLLEPMSACTVSVNKSTISAVLPARTGVLASANPMYGNYDIQKPLAKQIDLPTPIIDRFDLIFVMIDKPNKDIDSKIVEFIFKARKEKIEAKIPTDLFKKYITYCKKLNPELDESLLVPLQDFYTKLREQSHNEDVKGIPLNPRDIEAIIKLSEAHAKLRLSNKVEAQDVEVAKGLFIFCLRQLGTDPESGVIDRSRLTQKVPVSKKGKVESLLDMIHTLSQEHNNLIPENVISDKCEEANVKRYEVRDFIEELKRAGKLFEPKPGFIGVI